MYMFEVHRINLNKLLLKKQIEKNLSNFKTDKEVVKHLIKVHGKMVNVNWQYEWSCKC